MVSNARERIEYDQGFSAPRGLGAEWCGFFLRLTKPDHVVPGSCYMARVYIRTTRDN